jgi:hypothetical protein
MYFWLILFWLAFHVCIFDARGSTWVIISWYACCRRSLLELAGHTSVVDWWALGSQSRHACAKQNSKYA